MQPSRSRESIAKVGDVVSLSATFYVGSMWTIPRTRSCTRLTQTGASQAGVPLWWFLFCFNFPLKTLSSGFVPLSSS